MATEAKDLLAGLAFFQEGKRVGKPRKGNYAVRPIAGGAFAKANGQDVIADLKKLFVDCVFLWLSAQFDPKAAKAEAENAGGEPDAKKPEGDDKSKDNGKK